VRNAVAITPVANAPQDLTLECQFVPGFQLSKTEVGEMVAARGRLLAP